MNFFIVYAHHEPTSFTSSMKNMAAQVLAQQGHGVVISDLYGQGFSAVAQKWDFVTTSGKHFNYMLEQKHAARLDLAFSPDVLGEIQKMKAADCLLFVAPIWWMGVPAILKGWFDRVLAMGVAWDGGKFYESGLMRGKQAMIIGAAGHPAEYYQENGIHKMDINQVLEPVNRGVLAFCGFNIHEPYVALNILGSNQPMLEKNLKELQFRLENLASSPQWHTFYN